MENKANCPICNNKDTETVYCNINSSFSHADLHFQLRISLCNDCAFIFQSSAYTKEYEKSTSMVYTAYRNKNDNFMFPRRCPDYADTLAMILANLPHRKNLNILEIGSNRGDMLYLIKEARPDVNIIGIEPTRFKELCVPTINTFFTDKLFSNKFDVIIMQHVLEHIKRPKEIMSQIRSIIDDKGIFYVEVPNVENTLKYFTEDFIADHVNYFSPDSLGATMEGFKIIKCVNRPFLRIVAKKDKPAEKLAAHAASTSFVKKSFLDFRLNKEKMLAEIIRCSKNGQKIVFYGVSSYFRILFKELKDNLNLKKCFYYDDNFSGDYEETFRLRRHECFDGGDVAIICSNVYRVQETIEKKLLKYKGLTLVRPWLGISKN